MTDPTATDDYRAILRTILEDPADDLPRLVLADWLDERGGRAGEIHARFIRRQFGGGTPWPNVPLTVLAQLPPLPGREPHQYSFNGSRAGTAEVVYDSAGGVRLIYSRGFVSAVTLSQAALVGGDCDRCGGSGRLVIHHRTHGDCLTCDGTGRTPGLAAALFTAHPIEVVTLADFAPMTLGEEAGEPYFAALDGALERPHMVERAGVTAVLAPALYGRVAARASWANRTYCSFVPSLASLLTAVSDACVALGRDLAGLPALAAGVPARPAECRRGN